MHHYSYRANKIEENRAQTIKATIEKGIVPCFLAYLIVRVRYHDAEIRKYSFCFQQDAVIF
jgi:hypothetical protein